MPDALAPVARRPLLGSAVRWLPIVLVILALPVLIFAGVRVAFRRIVASTDTPGVRQLHEVGTVVRRYAQAHGGNYPASLDDLVDAGDLSHAMTLCPGGRYPYTYLGGGLSEQTVTNGTVLAHEPLAADDDRGGAVLYADGSTSWVARTELEEELKRGVPPAKRPQSP